MSVRVTLLGQGGGGGDSSHIVLTQADYDALVQAGTLDPNAYYFISDAPGITTAGGTLSITLLSSGWTNNVQTISNAAFSASGYAYLVKPASSGYTDYVNSQIYADDVTVNGSMTFHCETVPQSDITVNVLKMGVVAI